MTITLATSRGRRGATLALIALLATALTLSTGATATARTTSTASTTHAAPLLAQGAGMGARPSRAVRRVQRVLAQRGYDLGAPGVDGRFGPITNTAVRRMQADNGLVSDGLVGRRTSHALGLSPNSTSSNRRTATPPRRPGRNRRTARHIRPSARPQRSTGAGNTGPGSPTRTTTTEPTSNTNSDLWPLALGAALGAFFATLFSVAIRRSTRRSRGRTTVVAPIPHELYVEGSSEASEIGAFRGRAIATALTGSPDADPAEHQRRYLIDDAGKPAPVWVQEADIHRAPTRLAPGEEVIGYVTLSADPSPEEADEPTQAIADACEVAGWRLLDVVTDRETGRGLERPGLTFALRQIADRRARGLVVADLRRLSPSIVDLGALIEWFREADAALIALDLGIDTSTPGGDEVAATLVTLGGWERERIARRTRNGLADVRASGRPAGRPAVTDRPELAERITAMRAADMTLQAIADQLNAEGVPTIRGGRKWRPSSVQAVLGYRRPGSRGPRDQLPSLEQDRPA